MAKDTKAGAPGAKADKGPQKTTEKTKAGAAAKPDDKAKKAAAKGTKDASADSGKAAAPQPVFETGPYKPRLQEHYETTVRKALQEKYKNIYQVPKLDKIVINMGVGEATGDSRRIQAAVSDMIAISGQKPVVTKSRKSIAQFKLREGMPIGVKVTLRRARMYEFLDRLVTIALPRVRDFRGLPGNSFDGNGNYSMGLKEQIVFPEIDYDKIDMVRGMDIVICTTARTDAEAKELLRGFNMPFIT